MFNNVQCSVHCTVQLFSTVQFNCLVQYSSIVHLQWLLPPAGDSQETGEAGAAERGEGQQVQYIILNNGILKLNSSVLPSVMGIFHGTFPR